MHGPTSVEIIATCVAIYVQGRASTREDGLLVACRIFRPKGQRLPTATNAAGVRSSFSVGRVLAHPISSETRGLAQGRGPLAISVLGEAPFGS